jgi:hypothetical protein
MVGAKKSSDIGMKRGRALSNLPQPKQLEVIAEGLPILMKSADSLMTAAKAIGEHNRPALILEGHAKEEIAKILILMDIVRCPPKVRPSRIGPMIGWFYNHLARLIYFDAQTWKPIKITQLQQYVDSDRKSHFLEGSLGEYILPNWTAWSRESMLYADIITDEDGGLNWNDPEIGARSIALTRLPPDFFDDFEQPAWIICKALHDIGAFTRPGLDIVSAVWSQTEFVNAQNRSDADNLTREMLLALYNAGLISEAANNERVNLWQLPMYHIDFNPIEVPLQELQAERDANYRWEVGY